MHRKRQDKGQAWLAELHRCMAGHGSCGSIRWFLTRDLRSDGKLKLYPMVASATQSLSFPQDALYVKNCAPALASCSIYYVRNTRLITHYIRYYHKLSSAITCACACAFANCMHDGPVMMCSTMRESSKQPCATVVQDAT